MGRRDDRQLKVVMKQSCPSDPRIPLTRLWQAGRKDKARYIMILSHDLLKTWGESLRRAPALAKRRRLRGYDAVKLPAAFGIPGPAHSRAGRGAWQIRQQDDKSKSDTMKPGL